MKCKLAKKIRKFFLSRRAVNVVVSTVLMASAVMALGFAVLYWTQQKSLEANVDYLETTDKNIASVQEKLGFEYIHYNSVQNQLSVYLMNCGKSDDLRIARVYLGNSSWSQSFDDIELRFLDSTPTQSLGVLEEGYFQMSIDFVIDTEYYIRILTQRGRFFVTTFVP